MIKILKNQYKLHVFIFVLLSIHLFILSPVSFINKFLAASVCIGVFFHLKDLSFEFKNLKETIIFVILNAYLTFAIFGYDLFLFCTLYSELFLNSLTFLLGFIWTGYVLKSFLNAIEWLSDKKNSVCFPTEGGYTKKWLMLFGIMFALFMVWQRAFNPIILSPDSYEYISGSYIIGRSVLYVLFNNIIFKIVPAARAFGVIAAAQIAALSCILSTVLMYFHKKWIKFKWIVITAAFLPLIPSFALNAIVVWADLMVGICVLWVAYATVRIIDEIIINNTASKNERISNYVQLCASLVFLYFTKANTAIVYVAAALSLAVLFILRKQWKLLLSVGFSVVFVLLIRFPGHALLGAEKWGHLDAHKYYAGIHDMQATYYGGGKLSRENLDLLKKYIPNIDELKEDFKPDHIYWSTWGNREGLIEEMTTKEFVSMYTDTLFKNPGKMIRSMLFRNRIYWVIDTKKDITCMNYTDVDAQRPGRRWVGELHGTDVFGYTNSLTKVMDRYMLIMGMQIPATFIWRVGIWTALIFTSIVTLIYRKRYIWIIAYIPILVYLVTLLLTNGWTDYRYGLPVFFVGMFLPASLLLLTPELDSRLDIDLP